MRPGTGQRDVKVVAIGLGLVGGRVVLFNPTAKRISLTLERSALGLLIGELRIN